MKGLRLLAIDTALYLFQRAFFKKQTIMSCARGCLGYPWRDRKAGALGCVLLQKLLSVQCIQMDSVLQDLPLYNQWCNVVR